MPKMVSRSELDRVMAEISKHPEGIGPDALLDALQGTPARRTLQRRLATLVQQQRLVTLGAGRAVRYRAAPPWTVSITESADRPHEDDERYDWSYAYTPQPSDEAHLPTSTESEETKAYVRRPLQARRPVAYDIAFLEAYAPNHTAYLPEALRAQLHTLGRSGVDQEAAAGTFARDILNRLLIDLSWASSRLEGNTYTRLDTERLIEFGQAAEGKDAFETQMILNHKAAIEYMVGDARVAVDTDTVIALHALLSDGLLRDPMAGGRVRQRAVEIDGSVYRPIALPQRLEELFGIVMQIAAEIVDPFERAFFLMVHLPYLQPFEDVNKRVSRLVANIPLMRHNLSPLSFIDVPAQAYVDGMLGVYELTRVELLRDVFVWAYERSCQQYVAVRQQLIPPDTFRLRYRAELGAAVKTLVQQGLRPDDDTIARAVPSTIEPGDRERFAALLRAELNTLHEGNAIRFGLRPLEFAAWKNATRQQP
jgi:Fic/DOC family